MRLSRLIFLAIFPVACGGSIMYTSYTSWDENDNEFLDRSEFVKGYTRSGYFEKWSDNQEYLRYEDLYEAVLADLDADKDDKLSLVEFNSRIDYYYFGLFNGTFDDWDFDSNASIDKNEFYSTVCKTNLASIWDTSDDNRVSGRELAGGMFYLSDANSDGRVSALEFNTWRINR